MENVENGNRARETYRDIMAAAEDPVQLTPDEEERLMQVIRRVDGSV